MAKIYVHTPLKQFLNDFKTHLHHDVDESGPISSNPASNQKKSSKENDEKNLKSSENLGSAENEYSALILSPVDETRSFRQVLPLFVQKLSKKFKSLLKKEGMKSKVSWSWDEDLIIVLESLEDFLNLRWKVSFLTEDNVVSSEVSDFKSPMVSIGVREDVYVSIKLLTEKQENTFDFNEVEESLRADTGTGKYQANKEEGNDLVIEEISREDAEKDKEAEKRKREEEDKRTQEEFEKFKNSLETTLEDIKKNQEQGHFRNVIDLSEKVLESLALVKTNKREHAIYLTEKRIETSLALALVYLETANGVKAKKLLTPLVAIAKKGPVDTYINVLLTLGDAEFLLEDYEESMKAYSMCLSVKKKFKKEEKMAINAKRAITAIKFEEDDSIGYVKYVFSCSFFFPL